MGDMPIREMVTRKRMMVFAGTAHPELAHEICEHLGIRLTEARLNRFSSGEIYFRSDESARGVDAFVIQTHAQPVNESIMEQLIMIDALKRASAKRITAVVPYYGYSRQDKKALAREPISAKLMADLFSVAGADRVVSVDLHSGQIQGFFNFPVDHLTALPVLADYMRSLGLPDDAVVVAPDTGRVKVAERLAEILQCDLAFMYKRRSRREAHKIEKMELVGEVDGRPAILVDDMVDTAGTVADGARVLSSSGASEIYVGPPTRCSRARPPSVWPRRPSRRSSSPTRSRSPRRRGRCWANACGSCPWRRSWPPRCAPCSKTSRSPRSSTATTSSSRGPWPAVSVESMPLPPRRGLRAGPGPHRSRKEPPWNAS